MLSLLSDKYINYIYEDKIILYIYICIYYIYVRKFSVSSDSIGGKTIRGVNGNGR